MLCTAGCRGEEEAGPELCAGGRGRQSCSAGASRVGLHIHSQGCWLISRGNTSLLAASLPLLQVGMQPPSLFPIPGVCEYSFLSGKLNILNKHCLKSIIYGQGFRRGDQSSLGAEGVSPSAAASTALFPVNWCSLRD